MEASCKQCDHIVRQVTLLSVIDDVEFSSFGGEASEEYYLELSLEE